MVENKLQHISKKILAIFLGVCLLANSFSALLGSQIAIPKAFAEANSCNASSLGDLRSYLSTRVGGVSLDQAAVFLADMSDITGSYYDADRDRVVFVGTKGNVSVPKFDKDDLAVVIRALVF